MIERLVPGPASVGDLHGPHDIALPTFLKHLKVLEAAGLVRSEKTGRVRIVHVGAAPPAEVEGWLRQQRGIWEGRLDRLFALMTDRAARAEWGAPSDDVVIEIDETDIRPGGREVARCGSREAPEFAAVSDFHVVTPDCLVLTETRTFSRLVETEVAR